MTAFLHHFASHSESPLHPSSSRPLHNNLPFIFFTLFYIPLSSTSPPPFLPPLFHPFPIHSLNSLTIFSLSFSLQSFSKRPFPTSQIFIVASSSPPPPHRSFHLFSVYPLFPFFTLPFLPCFSNHTVFSAQFHPSHIYSSYLLTFSLVPPLPLFTALHSPLQRDSYLQER